MEKYIGTKIIEAEPAYRIDGKVYVLSAPVPRSMNREEGYKVRYSDGYESTVAQWNSRSVCFGEDRMTVIFSEYELGPYALGTQIFEIQYDELTEALGQGGQVKLGLVQPDSTADNQ